MKILKDDKLSVLHRSFYWRREHTLSVGVFAGFVLDESTSLLDEPVMWKNAQESLARNQVLDVAMPKPGGEVLLAGVCCAPKGQEIRAAEVSFRLGNIRKRLHVFGDRYWTSSAAAIGRISKQVPFTRMAITWKNAFGGSAFEWNPVGKGIDPVETESGERVLYLPNIEDPDHLIGSPADRPRPAGFAPVDFALPWRLKGLGTYDARWKETAWPGLPDDFNWNYFNIAPEDQRMKEYFTGSERIEIEGMHPEKPLITARLPGLRARIFTNHKSEKGEVFREITTRLETVWLFPHLDMGVIIWRGTVPVIDDEASDVSHILAFYESSGDAEKPASFYRDKLREPAEEIKPVEEALPPPPEPLKAAALAIPAVVLLEADPAIKALLSGLEGEISGKEAELAARLKDLGVDPDRFKDVIPDKEDLPLLEKQPGQMVHELNQSIDDMEAELDKRLKAAGVDPDKPPQSNPMKSPPPQSGSEVVDTLKSHGIEDQDLFDKLHKLDEELQTVTKEHEALLAQVGAVGAVTAVPAARVEAGAAGMIPGMPKVGALKVPDLEVHTLDRAAVIEGFPQGRSFSGCDLTGADLSNLTLPDVDFSSAILESVDFTGSMLDGADFSGAKLRGADFSRAHLTGANLADTSAPDTKFVEANMEGAILSNGDFHGSDMTKAVLSRADVHGAGMTGANLSHVTGRSLEASRADFTGADLSAAAFAGASMKDVDMTGATMGKTDFSGANLEESRLSGAQGRRAVFVNAKMKRSRVTGPTGFVQADFSGACLADASWENADCTGADFSGADCRSARMAACTFQAANLNRVQAGHADFSRSDLSGARMTSVNLLQGSLRKARLVKTDLSGANLYAVDFYKSVMGKTKFDGANLKMTILAEWRPS